MPKNNKSIVKAASMERTLDGALKALLTVSEKGNQAAKQRSRESKKLIAMNKRLSTKRSQLNKKKKAATVKLMKQHSSDNKDNLSAITKELKGVMREIEKLKKTKANNAAELSALKSCVKRANAYLKCIERADKALQRPARSAKSRVKVA